MTQEYKIVNGRREKVELGTIYTMQDLPQVPKESEKNRPPKTNK